MSCCSSLPVSEWPADGTTRSLTVSAQGSAAHAERSGVAQDVTHFHQYPANWFQTGSEQSTGLGRHTDYTYTELSPNMACNRLFIVSKNRSVALGTWMLSSEQIDGRTTPRQSMSCCLHSQLFTITSYCCGCLSQTFSQTLDLTFEHETRLQSLWV